MKSLDAFPLLSFKSDLIYRCLHFNETFICRLKVFFFLFSDAYGCSEDPSLYVSERHSIKCIDIKTYNRSHVQVKTVKTGLADAGAIDIDHRERMIFWSDHEQWTINRMSLVTGETEVIIIIIIIIY